MSKPDRSGRERRKSVACLLAALSLAPAALLAGTNVVSRPVGLVRVLGPAGAEALVSIPFNPFNPDINAVFSNQLAGATNVNLADAIRQWDAAAQAYTNAYKAAGTGDPSRDGRWFADFSGWATSTLSFHPGAGFWIANRQGATQSVFLVGEVVLEDQGAVTFAPGLNLFGYPFSSRMALNDTTLRSDGAGGAPAMTNADNVSDLVGGYYVYAWLLDDTNSPNHGKWVDVWTSLNETILLPGRGYWYQRAPTNSFEWREGRPYGNPFPTNDDPPTVRSLLLNAGKDEVTLVICAAGAPGEKLDVYYKDVPETNVFNGAGWWMAALNLSPGGTTMSWTDAGSPSRGKVNTVYARYYLAGRADIDSDGDGVPDCREAFVYGSNPGSNDLAILIPFIFVEDFETNTVQTGDLNGQNGWTASPAGTCLVQTNTVRQGWQALKMDAGTNWLSTVQHEFDPGNENIAWVDFSAKVMPSAPPDELGSAGAAFYFDGYGRLVVYDGLRVGTNKWVALTNRAPVDAWARVTVRMDYGLQKWTVYLNGRLGAADLGFAAANTGGFKAFRVTSQEALLDAITVTSNRLAAVSMDGDSLPDDWEMAWFGDLGAQEAADPDGDGLSNLEEWLAGTNPVSADTDGDGMPDGWELLSGTDPLAADASADPDGDGLSNLEEYIAGTSPFSGDTDNDAIPDKWELDYGLDPLVNDAALDSDEDGLTNLQEYHLLTGPLSADTDNDGLNDMDEVSVRHTDPLSADTDGDGLPDGLEVICGLNPLVAGDDAGGDLDGDGLSNLTEYQLGTGLSESDTDGDGMNDYEETILAGSDPFVADYNGTNEVVVEAQGSAASNTVGAWNVWNDQIRSHGLRGELTYVLDVPQSGVYWVEIVGGGVRGNLARLVAYANEEFLGVNWLALDQAGGKVCRFVTPWLQSSSNSVRLVWDNILPGPEVWIQSIRLLSVGGPDVNGNGRPDWLDHRFEETCSMDARSGSKVSPCCIEGDAWFMDGLTLNSGTPQRANGRRWYANVPLSETGLTSIVATFDGSPAHTNLVGWTPFNVLAESNLTIRVGDALRLTAESMPGVTGHVSLAVSGVTNYETETGQPIRHLFSASGTFAVYGSFSNDSGVVSGVATVKVVSASLPAARPAVCQDQGRSWSCPGLPTGVGFLEGDKDLAITRSGQSLVIVASDVEWPHAVVVRTEPGGSILDARSVDAFWLVANVEGFYPIVETHDDGSRIVRNTMIARNLPDSVTVRLNMIVGGVTLDDGSTSRWVGPGDFAADDSIDYYLVISPSGYAACHSIFAYQNGVFVGGR